MLPDRGSNQRPLDSQSDSLPTALDGPATVYVVDNTLIAPAMFIGQCP